MRNDHRPVAILIAEADQIVRMVTADMLTDEGYQVVEVSTAREALAVFEGQTTVKMLITGRGIEGDGIALAHLVYHCWPGVAIIVTSGAVANLQYGLPPGTRLLAKPYDFAELIREVEALAQEREEPSAAPVLPTGLPPLTGSDMGLGVGAATAPTTEPDMT